MQNPFPQKPSENSAMSYREFTMKALIASVIVALIILAIMLIGNAFEVMLLIFAATLFGVFLRALSTLLCRYTPLSHGISLAIVLLFLLVVIGGGSWLLAPSITEQADKLSEELPKAVKKLEDDIKSHTWGEKLLDERPSEMLNKENSKAIAKQAFGVFTSTIGVLANMLIIIVLGIFLAASPGTYTEGVVRLVPLRGRKRAQEVLDKLANTLKSWLVGRIIAMVVVGILTTIGLWILGVPLALVLGIFAGLMDFVPTIGPLIAAGPAILLALLDSPMQAVYVAILYFGIQSLESYLVTPLIQARAVSLPPVITLLSIILFGYIAGIFAVVLATPIAACILVLVKMLYVKDILGDKTVELSSKSEKQIK